MMGAGKSTVGKLLAKEVGLTFLDADEVIEVWAGKPISRIFEDEGEETFRRSEAKVLNYLADSGSAVIALGGGAIENGSSRKRVLETGTLVWLDTSPKVAASRIKESDDRPLLEQEKSGAEMEERLGNLLEIRRKNYSKADITIQTDNKTPGKIVQEIINAMKLKDSKLNDVSKVKNEAFNYSVFADNGILGKVVGAIDRERYSDTAIIITDSNVGQLYHEQVQNQLEDDGFTVHTEFLPPGEQTKSLELMHNLYIKMSRLGLDRKSPVFALGGGVIGDFAGFFAASYLRGVPLIHVPTSLLAQVDSSIGGKVGVNLPTGKNLVGAFYNPDVVLADINTLHSLPDREWNTGLGEVIKYGFIGEAAILEYLKKGRQTILDNITEVVRRSIAKKLNIVARDFKEGGIRRFLNFGHTLGHSLENVTDYTILNHGEAIFWGMIAALYISKEKELMPEADFEQAMQILERMDFVLPDFEASPEALYEALHYDKKRVRDSIHWVLLESLGSPVIETDVDKPLIMDAIQYTDSIVGKEAA